MPDPTKEREPFSLSEEAQKQIGLIDDDGHDIVPDDDDFITDEDVQKEKEAAKQAAIEKSIKLKQNKSEADSEKEHSSSSKDIEEDPEVRKESKKNKDKEISEKEHSNNPDKKKSDEKSDEKSEKDKSEKDKSSEKEDHKSEANSSDDSSSGEHSSSKDGEENKDDDDADAEKGFDFAKTIKEAIDADDKLKDDEEYLKKLASDIKNHSQFHKSNTETAQKLATIKKDVQGVVDRLGLDSVKEAMDDIAKISDIDEVQDILDDWFDGKENNPFRKLVSSLNESIGETVTYSEEQIKLSEERSDFEFEKAVHSLKLLDECYDDYDEVEQLCKISDDEDVSLMNAHKIRAYDKNIEMVNNKNDEIKNLNKELKTVKKELKARNEEIKKGIKVNPVNKKTTSGASGGLGATGESYAAKSSGFDETEGRLRKRLSQRQDE